MNDHELQHLLKDWDRQIVPPQDGRDRLQANLARELAAQPMPRGAPRPSRLMPILAIAAGLCLAFLAGFWAARHKTSEAPPPTVAAISSETLANLGRITAEVDHLFPEGVRWIRQVDDGELQIDANAPRSIHTLDGKILIRYVVLKRDQPCAPWHEVHTANLIAAPGEPIELVGQESGYLWVYPAGDNVFAVESQLALTANGHTLHLEFQGGVIGGAPRSVKTVHANGADYLVFQEIATL
jgi:hypothetical protein